MQERWVLLSSKFMMLRQTAIAPNENEGLPLVRATRKSGRSHFRLLFPGSWDSPICVYTSSMYTSYFMNRPLVKYYKYPLTILSYFS